VALFRLCLFALGLALAAGCGSSSSTTDNNPGDQKSAGSGRLTIENVSRIQAEQMNYNGAVQMFAAQGEPTNEEKPGLMPGSKYVWKEGGKKVYVSFGLDGKANGVAWEGFAGK